MIVGALTSNVAPTVIIGHFVCFLYVVIAYVTYGTSSAFVNVLAYGTIFGYICSVTTIVVEQID